MKVNSINKTYDSSATASAQRSPSIAADTIPPAYPAPSPHGNNPGKVTCSSLSLSRGIRTGAEVRLSTAIIRASRVRNPFEILPK